MKSPPSLRRAAALAAALLLPLTGSLRAQPAGNGSIVGVVTDARTHDYLPGAEVRLSGTGYEAVAGRDGSFSLLELPVGSYVLVASADGYPEQSFPVVVSAGRIATLPVPLHSEVVQLTPLVVEGALAGQALAISQQAAAPGNVDMVSADAIGNFPDQNAAQALQRVSGVSVQQLYGQATTVSIRGAGSDMNSTTLDGVMMMGDQVVNSTGNNVTDGRSVSLSDFPAQLLENVTVVKTVTPDLDANAIGGVVQLQTKDAFDFAGPVLSFNAGYQYSSQSQKLSPQFGLAFASRFGANQDWGISVAASDERRQGLEEQVEVKSEGTETYTVAGTPYTGYTMLQPEFGNYDYDEHRTAASVSLDKKFGDSTHLFIRATRTLWIQKSGRPSLDLIDSTSSSALSASGPVVLSDGAFQDYTMTGVTVQRSTNPRTLADTYTNASIGGDTQVDAWKFSYLGDYNAGYGEVDAEGSQWQAGSTATIAYNYANPFFPSYNVVAGPNIYDPTQFTLKQFKANETLESTDQYTAKLDAERPWDVGNGQITVKAGVNFRWSELDNSKLAPTYTPVGTLSMVNPAYSLIGDSNPDLLSHYDLGPSVGPYSFSDWALANLGDFTLNTAKTLSTDLAGDDTFYENVAAGYLMGTWNWDKLTVIAGARYETTQDHSQGYEIPATASANPAAYPILYYQNNYDEFMPGVLLRYSATKRLVFRTSWTNTLARPDLEDLAPTQNVDLQATPTAANPDTVTGGNPSLAATTSSNLDASVDYYFPGIGLVSAGVFYKAVDNPVYQNTSTGSFIGEPALYTTFDNAGHAWIRGAEFEYQENLSFLPAPFNGLGLYGNMTLVNSSVHVAEDPGEEFTFFYQANKVANAGLSYQKGPFYARLAYNWTGSYLFSIDSPTLREYQAPFHTLDFITTYKLASHWTVKFTANNLTKFPTREYFNSPSFLDVYAQDGQFFTLGVTWEY